LELFERGDLSELLHVKDVLNSSGFTETLRPFGAGFLSLQAGTELVERGDLGKLLHVKDVLNSPVDSETGTPR